jgi:phosphoribosylformylglycinamidine (FGAM) synthase-like enzyme
LAVAAAEMAFSGEIGAAIDLDHVLCAKSPETDEEILFSESPSRFLVEVYPEQEKAFIKAMRGIPMARIGSTIANPILRVVRMDGSTLFEEPLGALKSAWTRTLPGSMDGIGVKANGHRKGTA